MNERWSVAMKNSCFGPLTKQQSREHSLQTVIAYSTGGETSQSISWCFVAFWDALRHVHVYTSDPITQDARVNRASVITWCKISSPTWIKVSDYKLNVWTLCLFHYGTMLNLRSRRFKCLQADWLLLPLCLFNLMWSLQEDANSR